MNISLVGMMGCGKTTIGEILAKELGLTFVDTDYLIVKKEGVSINEIFSSKGEEYFRIVEHNVLSEVLNKDNLLVSTGGGIILREDNRLLLKQQSKMVYLKASEETLYNRVKNDNNRPLLNINDVQLKIHSLLEQRKSLYAEATFVVDTNKKSVEDVVKELKEKLVCRK